ncbi:transposase zinc-binding domain-containing protein [Stieleria varia]|uniref:Transposase zinc-binding domain-containing protein n=1 Tax=Stieleria varia TaxID=2528005 RepID=A0A5C6B2U9_9BACT|nr:transposase zinc-binding domain-containing protein [Stieleria varia]TWU05812.1 hypothetical protein Pla52n_15270 [Stieleria varia]
MFDRKAANRQRETAAQRLSIAKVIAEYGGDVDYRDGLPMRAGDRTAKVMSLIPKCRTGALGGCTWQCRDCDSNQLVLKSCGDRHCPTCSATSRYRWHEQLLSWAIGCDYLHQVVTVPHELNDLIAANHKRLIGDV